jgi:hypothetical protein
MYHINIMDTKISQLPMTCTEGGYSSCCWAMPGRTLPSKDAAITGVMHIEETLTVAKLFCMTEAKILTEDNFIYSCRRTVVFFLKNSLSDEHEFFKGRAKSFCGGSEDLEQFKPSTRIEN